MFCVLFVTMQRQMIPATTTVSVLCGRLKEKSTWIKINKTTSQMKSFRIFKYFKYFHTKSNFNWDQNKSPQKNNQNHFTDEKFVDFQPA